jgi:alcohol dehydrogenase
MVGVVHALGHAAGALCHLHHGTAMSLFLPVGLRFGLNRRAEAIGELLLPFGGADLYARVPARDRAERLLAELASFRDFIYEKTRLPRTLREAGVAEAQLDAIARTALSDGSLVYCAEEVTLTDARRLVQEAF